MSRTMELDPDAKDSKGPQHLDECRPPPPSYTAHASSSAPFRVHANTYVLPLTLNTLPSRLLSKITSLLDPVSKRCLYLTNQRFRSLGQHDKEELTRCGKWLVMAYLEQDFLNRLPAKSTSDHRKSFSIPFMKSPSSLPKDLSKLTCSLCKTKHAPDSFLNGAPRTAGIHAKTERDLLTQKSLQRICTWHFGKLVCVVNHQEPAPGTVFYGRWISMIQEMCMHCGQIEKYGCYCRVATKVNGKTVPPDCEICPRVKVRVYERIRKESDKTDISWCFKTDKDGTVYVLEERTEWGRGK